MKLADVNTVAGFMQGALVIGRMPLMLRSCRCVLSGKNEAQLAKAGLNSLLRHLLFCHSEVD
jgi:hypothetical protein